MLIIKVNRVRRTYAPNHRVHDSMSSFFKNSVGCFADFHILITIMDITILYLTSTTKLIVILSHFETLYVILWEISLMSYFSMLAYATIYRHLKTHTQNANSQTHIYLINIYIKFALDLYRFVFLQP